ncbi:polysaccharide deacetylase family protein [Dactylosporangium sp. CA-092794]|uniref:polysaccharide deacetylase family protein n=1 Tax=Dactylosporangium sp. CA-092794 TaxID=3239929 RepID=UPI003D93D718
MPTSVVNITVHGIGPTSRTLDPGESNTWVSVEQFEQVLDAAVGRDDVRITFDDGNASDVRIGLPRLVERGLTAQFFVLAGEFGKPGRVSVDGVRELVAAGMSVGSHGWAHRDWRRITPEQAQEEIADANRVIGEITGAPVTDVAVPFGSYDRVVLGRLRRASMRRVYTSDGGRAQPDGWLQARNSIRHDLDADWIEHVFNGRSSPQVIARRFAARNVKRLRGAP